MAEPDQRIIDTLNAITDPVERATRAHQFIVKDRATIAIAETIRKQALRAAREQPNPPTIDQLAAALKVGRHVIVDATRKEKP